MAKVSDDEYQTDKFLSDKAYDTSNLKKGSSKISVDQTIKDPSTHQDYLVVATADNNNFNNKTNKDFSNNGFQGLAVAPIKNGQPDYSHTTIAYAGTDAPGEPINDGVIADGGNVVGGLKTGSSQFDSAESFYKNVSKIKGVKVSQITGHSLGGALAQKVAATNHVSAMTFSSADVAKQLTQKEKQWLLVGGKQKVINLVHYNDFVALWTADQPYGTTIFAKTKNGIPIWSSALFCTHNLGSYDKNFKEDKNLFWDNYLYGQLNRGVRKFVNMAAIDIILIGGVVKVAKKAGWFKKGTKLAEKTGKSILSGIEGLFVTTASADTIGGKVEVDKDELDSVANALLSLNDHLDNIDRVNQNIMSDMDKIFKDVNRPYSTL